MVGAQLLFLRSRAARKVEHRHGDRSPSPKNDDFCCFPGRGINSSKIEDRRDLANDAPKQSWCQEIDGNQYKLSNVGIRGGDGDGHFTVKLAR